MRKFVSLTLLDECLMRSSIVAVQTRLQPEACPELQVVESREALCERQKAEKCAGDDRRPMSDTCQTTVQS